MIKLMLLIYNIMPLLGIPYIIKKKYWRELISFSIFYAIAFTLNLLYVLDINIPSPIIALKYVVEDVFHLKY